MTVQTEVYYDRESKSKPWIIRPGGFEIAVSPAPERMFPCDTIDLLDPFDEKGAEEVCALLNLPEVRDHLLWHPSSPDEVLETIRRGDQRYVAKIDEEVAGTILRVPVLPGTTRQSIESMAVHPKFQGRGIAGSMIDRVLQVSRDSFAEQNMPYGRIESSVVVGVDGWIVPVLAFLRRNFGFRAALPGQMETGHDVLCLDLQAEGLFKQVTDHDIMTSIEEIIEGVQQRVKRYPLHKSFLKDILQLRDYHSGRMKQTFAITENDGWGEPVTNGAHL